MRFVVASDVDQSSGTTQEFQVVLNRIYDDNEKALRIIEADPATGKFDVFARAGVQFSKVSGSFGYQRSKYFSCYLTIALICLTLTHSVNLSDRAENPNAYVRAVLCIAGALN